MVKSFYSIWNLLLVHLILSWFYKKALNYYFLSEVFLPYHVFQFLKSASYINLTLLLFLNILMMLSGISSTQFWSEIFPSLNLSIVLKRATIADFEKLNPSSCNPLLNICKFKWEYSLEQECFAISRNAYFFVRFLDEVQTIILFIQSLVIA